MQKQKEPKKSIITTVVLLSVLLTFNILIWDKSDLAVKSEAKNIVDTTEKVYYEEVSINPNPIFETGKASGNLKIANDKHNRYPERVEIYTNDTNQLIYSATIDVGSNINTDTLLVDLPKGKYSCTANFTAINPYTNGGVREDSTDITITIQG